MKHAAPAAQSDRPQAVRMIPPLDLAALEVEVIRRANHRPQARSKGQRLHRRRNLRQSGALCRARESADRLLQPTMRRKGAKVPANVFSNLVGRCALDMVAENFLKAEQTQARKAWKYYMPHHGPGECATAIQFALATPRNTSGFHSNHLVQPRPIAVVAAGTGRTRGDHEKWQSTWGGDLGHQCSSNTRSK